VIKRFYQRAEPATRAGGYTITLDGRPIKTPGKRDLLVPSGALAAAIA
jgi:chaperone required for assembly of F1-ATPase